MRREGFLVLMVLVLLAACGTAEEVAEVVMVETVTAPPADTPAPPADTPVPPTATPTPEPAATWTQEPETATPTPEPTATWTAVPRETPTLTVVPVIPVFRHIRNEKYLGSRLVDVYLPTTGDGPFPTLLMLHGATCLKTSLDSMATYFAERGMAAVVPNWGVHNVYALDWSDDFSNAFCALAWLHANAETYAFDLERVVVFGHSAGGFAASMIGAVDDPAEFLVDCPYQLPPSGWTAGVVSFGGIFGTKEVFLSEVFFPPDTPFHAYAKRLPLRAGEEAEILDTLLNTPYEGWRNIGGLSEGGTTLVHSLAPYWVDGSEPPFLLILGSLDETPIAGHNAFAGQLQAAGVGAEVVVIPGANHVAVLDSSHRGFEETCQTIEEFLAEVLK